MKNLTVDEWAGTLTKLDTLAAEHPVRGIPEKKQEAIRKYYGKVRVQDLAAALGLKLTQVYWFAQARGLQRRKGGAK